MQKISEPVSFPLVNVVGLPDGSVLVEVATSLIESHRIILTPQILAKVLVAVRDAHKLSLDIIRTVEKSKVGHV